MDAAEDLVPVEEEGLLLLEVLPVLRWASLCPEVGAFQGFPREACPFMRTWAFSKGEKTPSQGLSPDCDL